MPSRRLSCRARGWGGLPPPALLLAAPVDLAADAAAVATCSMIAAREAGAARGRDLMRPAQPAARRVVAAAWLQTVAVLVAVAMAATEAQMLVGSQQLSGERRPARTQPLYPPSRQLQVGRPGGHGRVAFRMNIRVVPALPGWDRRVLGC